MRLDYYTKAIVAAVGAGYGLYNVATAPNSPGGVGVVQDEWVRIVVTMVLVLAATWAVPNTLTPTQIKTAVATAAAEPPPAPTPPLVAGGAIPPAATWNATTQQVERSPLLPPAVPPATRE